MPTRKPKDYRKDLAAVGLSQREAARRCGVSPAHLHYVLTGARQSRTLIRKIRSIIEDEKEAAHA